MLSFAGIDTKHIKCYTVIQRHSDLRFGRKGAKTVIFLVIILILAVSFAVYATVATNLLTVREDTVSFSSLPDGADGMKIVLLTDIHDRDMNRRLTKKIKELRPDMIAICGDVHDRGKRRTPFFRLVKSLSRICPVYFVRGNHDPFVSDTFFYKRLRDYGVHILENDSEEFRGMTVYGIGFNNEPPEFGEGFSVLLAHDPDIFDGLFGKPDLMLSGHIHGGFVELPFIGGLFRPRGGRSLLALFRRDAYLPKYYKGVYSEKGKKLVVSRGVGCSGVPFRLLPPEINVITLRKTRKEDRSR